MTAPPGGGSEYASPAAARWLPRVLAAAVLSAALVTAYDVDPKGVVWGSTAFRGLLAVLGAALAIWIVRRGGETRVRVRLGPVAMTFVHGPHERSVAYEDIVELVYAPPFGRSRSWLPATDVVDRHGAVWRIPALLQAGDRLIVELVERAGRTDLASWAEARGLEARMGQTSRLLALGYGAAGSILGVATAFALR